MNHSPEVIQSSIGWVYVLENKAMPGLVKIGFTTGCPIKRAKALSSPSGIPSPFILVEGSKVYCARRVEAMAHKMLAMFRVDASREFFKVTSSKAVEVIRLADILVCEDVERESPELFDLVFSTYGVMKWPTCINPGPSMPGVSVPRFFGGSA